MNCLADSIIKAIKLVYCHIIFFYMIITNSPHTKNQC